jgi:hypothetical protein
MEGVIVDDCSELSSDPLLVQFVHGPTLFCLVSVYASKLFEESWIGESGKWSVKTMGRPLFSVMKSFSAVTVLSDRKIVEVVGVAAKTQR